MTGRVIQGRFLGPAGDAVREGPALPQSSFDRTAVVQPSALARRDSCPPPPPTRFGPGTAGMQGSGGALQRRATGGPMVAPNGRPSVHSAPPAPVGALPRASAAVAQQRPGASAVQRTAQGEAFRVNDGVLGKQGPGSALPDRLRVQMETALGSDFSAVRVHVGPQAARIGALAFTSGNDVYFTPGRYQPDTPTGRHIIGHELAHVVQQRQGRVRNPFGSGVAVVQDRALEAEAERTAATFLSTGPARTAHGPATIQPMIRNAVSKLKRLSSVSNRMEMMHGASESFLSSFFQLEPDPYPEALEDFEKIHNLKDVETYYRNKLFIDYRFYPKNYIFYSTSSVISGLFKSSSRHDRKHMYSLLKEWFEEGKMSKQMYKDASSMIDAYFRYESFMS